MIAHQHAPESSDINLAQVHGSHLLAQCQECGAEIHRPLFRPTAPWRDLVIKERYALVLVTTELDYLTDDGEAPEESGWDTVEKDLTDHLRRFQKYSGTPIAKFIEWEEADVNNDNDQSMDGTRYTSQ
jgi:hypothetical protein